MWMRDKRKENWEHEHPVEKLWNIVTCFISNKCVWKPPRFSWKGMNKEYNIRKVTDGWVFWWLVSIKRPLSTHTLLLSFINLPDLIFTVEFKDMRFFILHYINLFYYVWVSKISLLSNYWKGKKHYLYKKSWDINFIFTSKLNFWSHLI